MPRPTYSQAVALVDFMEKHQDLAVGRLSSPEARMKSDALWRQLSAALNAMGGCYKDAAIWRKFWNDKKVYCKKAAALRYKSIRGGTEKFPDMSALDHRILALMRDEYGPGIPDVAPPPFPLKLTEKSDNNEPEEDSERLGPLAAPPAKIPRMKANPSGTCAKDTQLHKAVQTIDETGNGKSPYSGFAEHVAYKLNTYDRFTRAQVEFKISKILFHADMGILQSEVTANSDPLSHADLHAEDHETIVKQEYET